MDNERNYYHTRDGGPPNCGRPPFAIACSSFPHFVGPTPKFFFPLGFDMPPLRAIPQPSPSFMCVEQPPPYQHCPERKRRDANEAQDEETPPGAKLEGCQFIFSDGTSSLILPKDITIIHVMDNFHKPWEKPGERFTFKKRKVPCLMSVRELIEQLGINPEGTDDSRGIAEALEIGDGTWREGSTFWMSDEKAKKSSLADVGWTPKRGTDAKPIWLTKLKQ